MEKRKGPEGKRNLSHTHTHTLFAEGEIKQIFFLTQRNARSLLQSRKIITTSNSLVLGQGIQLSKRAFAFLCQEEKGEQRRGGKGRELPASSNKCAYKAAPTNFFLYSNKRIYLFVFQICPWSVIMCMV